MRSLHCSSLVVADEVIVGASKNPFTKKPPGSNPFAKPAVAKPLDAIKSTSFFERVDNIESSGASKGEFRSSRTLFRSSETVCSFCQAEKAGQGQCKERPGAEWQADDSIRNEERASRSTSSAGSGKHVDRDGRSRGDSGRGDFGNSLHTGRESCKLYIVTLVYITDLSR